ncbi:MAG: hypothetical protein WCZ89_08600 [Phycisphaerae bacterium]
MKNYSFFLFKLAAGILILSAAAIASEPNNIEDIFKTNGFEWLWGSWQTTTDANEIVTAKFEPILNGHAFKTEAQIGESYHYAGLVYYDPAKKIIVNTGIDNTGRIFGGNWEITEAKLLLNIEQTSPDGTVSHFMRYLTQVNPNTMNSATYSVFEGRRSTSPINVLDLKRIK